MKVNINLKNTVSAIAMVMAMGSQGIWGMESTSKICSYPYWSAGGFGNVLYQDVYNENGVIVESPVLKNIEIEQTLIGVDNKVYKRLNKNNFICISENPTLLDRNCIFPDHEKLISLMIPSNIIDRGAFEEIRSGRDIAYKAIGKRICIIPGSEHTNELKKNEAIKLFREEHNIPQAGIGANIVSGFNATQQIANLETQYAMKFANLHLAKYEPYFAVDGLYAGQIIGFKVFFNYIGLTNKGNGPYGICTTPGIVMKFNDGDYNFIYGHKQIDQLSYNELGEYLSHKVPETLDRLTFNAFSKTTRKIEIKSPYGTSMDCIMFGSNKKFMAKTPESLGVDTRYLYPDLSLKTLPSIYWENGKPIGLQATYSYIGRETRTITYTDKDRELPVLFRFTEEEAKAILNQMPQEKKEDWKFPFVPASVRHEERPIRVCVIAGGGTRGLIPAVFLKTLGEKIQKEYNETLAEYFDLMCGTSTGGILAIASSLGISHNDLQAIYENDSENIFKGWGTGLGGTIHNHNDLKAVLDKNLLPKVNPKFNECMTHTFVVTGESKGLKSWCLTNEQANDTFNWEINTSNCKYIPCGNLGFKKPVRCTSAAPTYFVAPTLFEDSLTSDILNKQGISHTFIDGGCFENFPLGSAYRYVKNLQERNLLPQNRKIEIVCLGTGYVDSTVNIGWAADTGGAKLAINGGLLGMSEGSQNVTFENDMDLLKELGVDVFVQNPLLCKAIDLATYNPNDLNYMHLQALLHEKTENWTNMENQVVPTNPNKK